VLPWRDHDWEDTGTTEQALIHLYRLWRCKRCGFQRLQKDGEGIDKFELAHGEWDCDLQLVKGIMDG
jgi:hypothetical protein